MNTATFYIDQEYRESAESAGFDIIEHDAEMFKVIAKNVDPNALKSFPDWGDLAQYYGLLYESIIYVDII
mgnify:FL=1|jgi:hypothetical protein|tara:strand:- start:6 stop:215 length:210 start_codon:yes stop_codon:yes gene_type:complete